MAPSEIAITARDDLTADEVDGFEDRIYEHNAARTGYRDAAQIAFLAHAGGELVGFVAGFTWGGICELQQVWVREDQRGGGLGRTLLQRAIDEARARGCAHVFLATYDFQAPGFYAKFGFRTVAELPDKPIGHTEYVMRLALHAPQ